mgnify:CR=1 FL=1
MNAEKLRGFLIEPSPEDLDGKNLGDIGVITMSPQLYKKYKLGWLVFNVGFTTKSIASQVSILKKSKALKKGIMYAPLTEKPVFVYGFDLVIWSHGFLEKDTIKSNISTLSSSEREDISQEKLIYTAKPRYIFSHPKWALSESINVPSLEFAQEILRVPNLDLGTDYDFEPEFWNPYFLDYNDNQIGIKC